MANRNELTAYDLLNSPLRRRVLQGTVALGVMTLVPPFAYSQSPLIGLPRNALVIGNSKYKESPLKNPTNDAKAIGEALEQTGFEVTTILDAGRAEMAAAVQAYVQELAKRKSVGLFYFAGHGLQLAWRNYILPVDAEIDTIANIQKQSVEVGSLLAGLGKAANPMNVVILDACRDNPFGSLKGVDHKGLSQMDAPTHTLLAYATSPGNVASDGSGSNGLYTENLLRELKTPEAKIEDVFKRVRLAVRRRSNGEQIPWESTSLEEDFYFHPPKTTQKLSEAEVERRFDVELAVWEKAKAAGDPVLIEDYLRRYPSGLFSELAQLRLDQVLSGTGERKIQLVSSDQNPYSKGTLVIDTRVKLGDRYSYRELDLDTREENRRYTLAVTKISGNEVTYGKSTVTDLLGNWIKLPDGRQWTDAQFFIAEYSLGKRWTSRHRYQTRKGNQFSTEYDFKVVARESITVPAGTFDAFRVNGSGWTRGETGVVQLTMRYWVTPSVRRWVALENVHRGARSGRVITNHRIELLEYCCA